MSPSPFPGSSLSDMLLGWNDKWSSGLSKSSTPYPEQLFLASLKDPSRTDVIRLVLFVLIKQHSDEHLRELSTEKVDTRLKLIRGTKSCCMIRGQHEFLLCFHASLRTDCRYVDTFLAYVWCCSGLWVFFFVSLELLLARAENPKHVFSSMNIYGSQIFQHTFACVIRL